MSGPRAARALLAAALLAPWALTGCAGSSPSEPPPGVPLPDSSLAGLGDALAELGPEGVVAAVSPSESAPMRIVLARRCAAPPQVVLDVVFDVEGYDALLAHLETEDVRVLDERTREVGVEVDLPLGGLSYRLRLVRAPGRIDVYGIDGALAGGRWSWRAIPREGGSLVVYASEASFGEESGWFVDSVMALDPDLEPGLFFSQGLRFLVAVCREAERRARSEGPR